MRASGRAASPIWLRSGIALLGAAVLALGSVAVYTTSNGAGSAALITVGVALALVAALGDRVEALELGSAKQSLRELAETRFVLASATEAAGDDRAAAKLRQQGMALERLANAYTHMRRTMRSGHERTAMLEDIMGQ